MQAHIAALQGSKYCSLWHDQDVRPDTLPAVASNLACELCIVGGGFTGLWAALQAKERQPDADIVLIDAPLGGTKVDALAALKNGDPCAIGAVITAGVPRFVGRSNNTPPPIREIKVLRSNVVNMFQG